MIQPLFNNVLVKVEGKTDDDVLISPEKYKEKPFRGTVLGVGDQVDEAILIKDKVFFKYFMGIQVYLDEYPDNECLILEQDSIVGKEI